MGSFSYPLNIAGPLMRLVVGLEFVIPHTTVAFGVHVPPDAGDSLRFSDGNSTAGRLFLILRFIAPAEYQAVYCFVW